jgi:hypothetical protein
MKAAICVLVVILSAVLCSCQRSLDLGDAKSSAWVDLHRERETTIKKSGCSISQRLDASTRVRSVYIKRETDSVPVLIYTHKRRIKATPGHRTQLVLINDYFATKTCKVIVADIESGSNWRIDQQALRQYLQTAPKDCFPRQSIPEAIAFSPDDKMVLIAMKSDYVARSAEEAGQFGNRFKIWSYVVDCDNGSVLHTYRTNTVVPISWWKFPERI